MYDVIVIGCGSMGMSACYYLASKGVSVLGLDQFEPPHNLGGHNGESRIVRKAYFEHPDYVPLLMRSYQLWAELEHKLGEKIFYKTGLIYFGNQEHPVMRGVRNSAEQYKIQVESIDAVQEFEQFNLPNDFKGLFESDAGFVIPEKCISGYKSMAKDAGANLKFNERVLSFKKEADSFKVRTVISEYHTHKLVISSGPWVNDLVPGLSKTITITRQVLAWVKPKKLNDYSIGNFPCWIIADEQPGIMYGFPAIHDEVKFAWHYPGNETDAHAVNRTVNSDEISHLNSVAQRYLPQLGNSINRTSVCLYDNSPDENFLLGKLPGHENVFIASGFSGHGFKFVPVIGEIISNLVLHQNKLNIDFLTPGRYFKLKD